MMLTYLAPLGPLAQSVQSEVLALYAEGRVLGASLAASRLVWVVVGAIVLYQLYAFLFRPLRLVRQPQEIGYLPKEKQSTEQRMAQVSKRRMVGDLPPVYPNGWYELMRASDLHNGDVKSVAALGREFCVFRGQSGKAGVLDAYCPHLGANISAGGEVHGDCVTCPFHGWSFDASGECKHISYSDTIPAKSSIRSYPFLEINDEILLWFDAEGREPQWFPPKLDSIADGSWTYRGMTQHPINAHIQEVPENAADVAHLNYLHGPCLLTGTDLRYSHKGMLKFIEHRWTATWAPVEEEGQKHLSILHLVHYLTFFGFHLPVMDIHVTATQVGPALVYLTWKSSVGKGVFVQSLTPEEPMQQVLTHRVYASWTVPTFAAKIFMAGEAGQVERDLMVWNNKRYRGKPVLAKEDHLIARHRRWYSQFYSENSPRLENAETFEW